MAGLAAAVAVAQPPPVMDSDVAGSLAGSVDSVPPPSKKRGHHHHLNSDSDYGVSAPQPKKRRGAPGSATQLKALPDHVLEDLDGAPLISHMAHISH